MEVSAQSFFNNKQNRRFLVSAGTGMSTYLGDLAAPGDYFDDALNFTVSLMFMVTPQISVEGEFMIYRIKGSDSEKLEKYDGGTAFRNLSFFSINQEVNVNASYYFLPNGTRYYQRQLINPFVFAGLGFTTVNPRAELNGQNYSLRQFQTEGVAYSPIALVIPLGIGARLMLGPYFNLVVEAGVRKTFTDYLDDVSDRYVDNASFDDPIAAQLADRGPENGFELRNAGSRRGNPDRDDAYFALSAKIEFYIPSNILGSSRPKAPGSKRFKTKRRRR